MSETEHSETDLPREPGEQLARARRRKQLAADDIAGALHLPRSVIEDLEAGRFERIAAIYRRGYVRSYANLVDLDPEPLLAAMGDAEPEPLRSVLPVSGGGQRFERFVKLATYALVTTVIVPPLVYFFVQGGARLFESEFTARSGGNDRPEAATEAGSESRGRLAEALDVNHRVAGQGASHLSASALPVPMRSESVNEAPVRAASEPTVEASSEPIDTRAELVLELSDDSWVEIEGGEGERLEFDLLRAGEVRRYRAEPPFKLLLGRASAVSVALDGESVSFDGQGQAGVAEFVIGSPVEPSSDG